MNDRARPILRVAVVLVRLVLSALTFLLVGVTVFLVAFGVAAVATPSSSYDTIVALAIACGLAGGGLATLWVWRLSRRRTTRV